MNLISMLYKKFKNLKKLNSESNHWDINFTIDDGEYTYEGNVIISKKGEENEGPSKNKKNT